ncbi:hotdog fold thioesterase [Marivirga arenosa]|uniref:Hotdog fold thioesterase n=1 Tax=Marivirga arenosa TaxID=3059076 RepID=A0AA49J9I9_9BACT|nr:MULTISPECIES: hotdog fold thioesterase [unclassified Marivirga]WKK81435.1 hotdog fold thioesterase [Marivirga sp. BKB1-2]WKK87799.1 hotdog fold thioesterase [Marivirga sp. ABR2-2]
MDRKFLHKPSVEELNKLGKNTISEVLGMSFTEVGDNYLIAKMPVDHRTHQPYGLLHGGASVVLAETLGSVAAMLMVDQEKYYCVGLDINANHIRGIKEGWVYGKTTPVHVGKTTQVWQIEITNEREQMICISRITMAVVKK